MRILLDECLPKRLKRDLVGHQARTVPEMGWASKKNGELLALAEAEFDVFVTVDRNLSFQQDVNPNCSHCLACSVQPPRWFCAARPCAAPSAGLVGSGSPFPGNGTIRG